MFKTGQKTAGLWFALSIVALIYAALDERYFVAFWSVCSAYLAMFVFIAIDECKFWPEDNK